MEDLAGQLTRVAGGPVTSYRLQMLERDWEEARDQQEEVWEACDRCVTLTKATDEAETLVGERDEHFRRVTEQLRAFRNVLRERTPVEPVVTRGGGLAQAGSLLE